MKNNELDLNEFKLQAILAEYNALKSEIKYRSQFQNNLLQIHVTVLIAIVGIAFSKIVNYWIIFLLIPIESSIFGIWYFDHTITILEISTYLRTKLEPNVQVLSKYGMAWETEYKVGIGFKPLLRIIISLAAVLVTFAGPVIICILLFPFFYTGLQETNNSFETTATIVLAASDFVLFLVFWAVVGYFVYTSYRIDEKQKAK